MSKEIKNSKPVNIQQNGSYNSKFDNSLIYKYEIEFENGDIGEYSSKSDNQNKFEIGKQTEYEWIPTTNNFPSKIKPVSNFQPRTSYSNNNSDTQDRIRHAQAVNLAEQRYVHNKIEKNQIDETVKEIYLRLKNFNGYNLADVWKNDVEQKTKVESDLPF